MKINLLHFFARINFWRDIAADLDRLLPARSFHVALEDGVDVPLAHRHEDDVVVFDEAIGAVREVLDHLVWGAAHILRAFVAAVGRIHAS